MSTLFCRSSRAYPNSVSTNHQNSDQLLTFPIIDQNIPLDYLSTRSSRTTRSAPQHQPQLYLPDPKPSTFDMNISHDGPSLGPPNLPTLPNYPPYHPGHLVDASASNSNSTSPNESTRRPRVVPGDHGHGYANAIRGSPIKRSGSVSDDGNRSRNAKAQRRHREKRKAQLKLVSFFGIRFRDSG